ncbi:MAG: TRAP transporter small permease [Thermodesulfobacteriota bacterium]|nr:TRAP transporter small permease [Thermodesulfobacteriota bacterium]
MENRFVSIIDRYEKWLRSIGKVVDTLSAYLFLAVTLFVVIEVFCRYFFKSPHDWSDIMVVYTVLFVVFLNIGAVEEEERHICLDLVNLKLRDKWKRRTDMFNCLVSFSACGIMAYFVFNNFIYLVRAGGGYETSIPMPDWPPSLAMLMGMIMGMIVSLGKLFRLVLDRPVGKD